MFVSVCQCLSVSYRNVVPLHCQWDALAECQKMLVRGRKFLNSQLSTLNS